MKIDYTIAKALLKKGVALEDQELINMALSLLDLDTAVQDGTIEPEENIPESFKPAVKARKAREVKKTERQVAVKQPPAKKPRSTKTQNIVQQFTLTKDPAKQKYVPVRGGTNTWVDDGVACKTEDDVTPTYKPAPRQRVAATKIVRVCGKSLSSDEVREGEGCGAEIEINPKLAPDFFLCDDCLEEKRKGR